MSSTMLSGFKSKDSFKAMLDSGKDIYVLNNTEPRSLLICTVNDPISGKPQKLEFYRTWIPFCLTDMLPREVLEKSIEIRRFFQKGLLKLIPEEEAVKILDSNDGRQEYERLMQSEFTKGGKMTDRKQGMLDAERSAQMNLTSSGVNPNVQYNELNLHPKMRSWEMRSMVGELTGSVLLNELKIHANELSKDDVNFLISAQFPQEVKDHASELLKKGSFKERVNTQTNVEKADEETAAWG